MEINVQPKLQFLYDEKEINKYRQIILRGGRGGGKSYGIVELVRTGTTALERGSRALSDIEFEN